MKVTGVTSTHTDVQGHKKRLSLLVSPLKDMMVITYITLIMYQALF